MKKATKKTAKKAAKKVAKKAPKKTVGKKAVASKRSKTVVEAIIDVGFGNLLYIRGDAPGLSWKTGVPMDCAGAESWSISMSDVNSSFEYKVLGKRQQQHREARLDIFDEPVIRVAATQRLILEMPVDFGRGHFLYPEIARTSQWIRHTNHVGAALCRDDKVA